MDNKLIFDRARNMRETEISLYIPEQLKLLDFSKLSKYIESWECLLPAYLVVNNPSGHTVCQVLDGRYRPLVERVDDQLVPASPFAPLRSEHVERLRTQNWIFRDDKDLRAMRKLVTRYRLEEELLYRLRLARGKGASIGTWEENWLPPDLRGASPDGR